MKEISSSDRSLPVLHGLLLGDLVLEIGAGSVRVIRTLGRLASEELFTERDSYGAGC